MKIAILLTIVATAMADPTSFVGTIPSTYSYGLGGVFPSLYKGGDANTQIISNPLPLTYSNVVPSVYRMPSALTYASGVPSALTYASGVPSALTYASGVPSALTYRASGIPSALTYSASGVPSALTYSASGVPSALTYSASGIHSPLTYSASGIPSALTYTASGIPSVAFNNFGAVNNLAAVPKSIAETPGSRHVTWE